VLTRMLNVMAVNTPGSPVAAGVEAVGLAPPAIAAVIGRNSMTKHNGVYR
jgi:hypothetical protein